MTLTFLMPSWEIANRIDQSFNLPSDMDSRVARDHLRSLRFDQAPVMRQQRLIGWVRTTHLVSRGMVESRTTLLDKCTVLARETPVSDAIKLVAREHLVFLAGPTGIAEFVVTSDLDRHAVRCYLYVLLSELEMHMADHVEASPITDDEVRNMFQSRDRKRYDAARSNGMETRPVEYLVFSAYEKLAEKVPRIASSFPADIGGPSVLLKKLTRLRNCVAHPSKALTSEFDPSDIALLTTLAENVAESLRAERS